jgi:hypothetical protein
VAKLLYSIIKIVASRQTGGPTCSPKLGEFWRTIFEKKGNFRQKIEAVLPLGTYHSTLVVASSAQIILFFNVLKFSEK